MRCRRFNNLLGPFGNQAVFCDRLIDLTITVPSASKLSREITPSDMTQ
jgi:hypothetical protein